LWQIAQSANKPKQIQNTQRNNPRKPKEDVVYKALPTTTNRKETNHHKTISNPSMLFLKENTTEKPVLLREQNPFTQNFITATNDFERQ